MLKPADLRKREARKDWHRNHPKVPRGPYWLSTYGKHLLSETARYTDQFTVSTTDDGTAPDVEAIGTITPPYQREMTRARAASPARLAPTGDSISSSLWRPQTEGTVTATAASSSDGDRRPDPFPGFFDAPPPPVPCPASSPPQRDITAALAAMAETAKAAEEALVAASASSAAAAAADEYATCCDKPDHGDSPSSTRMSRAASPSPADLALRGIQSDRTPAAMPAWSQQYVCKAKPPQTAVLKPAPIAPPAKNIPAGWLGYAPMGAAPAPMPPPRSILAPPTLAQGFADDVAASHVRFALAKAEQGRPIVPMTASSPPASDAQLAWVEPENTDESRLAAFRAQRQQTPDQFIAAQSQHWETYLAQQADDFQAARQQSQQANAPKPFDWDKETF